MDPMINDSGGVSNDDDKVIVLVSPIRKMDEVDTPIISIFPTFISLLTTVKFMLHFPHLNHLAYCEEMQKSKFGYQFSLY